jgi:transcriptional regulator with GAF, ATPase, and Fis domain
MMTKYHFNRPASVNRWKHLIDRHNQERVALLQGLADLRITQTEAARLMGMTVQHLNQLIKTHNISWPIKAQGRQANDTE